MHKEREGTKKEETEEECGRQEEERVVEEERAAEARRDLAGMQKREKGTMREDGRSNLGMALWHLPALPRPPLCSGGRTARQREQRHRSSNHSNACQRGPVRGPCQGPLGLGGFLLSLWYVPAVSPTLVDAPVLWASRMASGGATSPHSRRATARRRPWPLLLLVWSSVVLLEVTFSFQCGASSLDDSES